MVLIANTFIVLNDKKEQDESPVEKMSLENEQMNNLKFFRRASEETIDTLIIDRSSEYVADIVK